MSAKHPTFSSGHCFMKERLNKQEVEYAGEILTNHLKILKSKIPSELDEDDYKFHFKKINQILEKMDYPLCPE